VRTDIELTLKLPADHFVYHTERLAEIDPAKVRVAVAVIKGAVPADSLKEIRKQAEIDPEEWWVGSHFHFGMSIRNLLRSNGCGEAFMGFDNLDDYYVPLLEIAAGVRQSEGVATE
jgi:hypothetical protein